MKKIHFIKLFISLLSLTTLLSATDTKEIVYEETKLIEARLYYNGKTKPILIGNKENIKKLENFKDGDLNPTHISFNEQKEDVALSSLNTKIEFTSIEEGIITTKLLDNHNIKGYAACEIFSKNTKENKKEENFLKRNECIFLNGEIMPIQNFISLQEKQLIRIGFGYSGEGDDNYIWVNSQIKVRVLRKILGVDYVEIYYYNNKGLYKKFYYCLGYKSSEFILLKNNKDITLAQLLKEKNIQIDPRYICPIDELYSKKRKILLPTSQIISRGQVMSLEDIKKAKVVKKIEVAKETKKRKKVRSKGKDFDAKLNRLNQKVQLVGKNKMKKKLELLSKIANLHNQKIKFYKQNQKFISEDDLDMLVFQIAGDYAKNQERKLNIKKISELEQQVNVNNNNKTIQQLQQIKVNNEKTIQQLQDKKSRNKSTIQQLQDEKARNKNTIQQLQLDNSNKQNMLKTLKQTKLTNEAIITCNKNTIQQLQQIKVNNEKTIQQLQQQQAKNKKNSYYLILIFSLLGAFICYLAQIKLQRSTKYNQDDLYDYNDSFQREENSWDYDEDDMWN